MTEPDAVTIVGAETVTEEYRSPNASQSLPVRSFRSPDEVWLPARERARLENVPGGLSAAINAFLRGYGQWSRTPEHTALTEEVTELRMANAHLLKALRALSFDADLLCAALRSLSTDAA